MLRFIIRPAVILLRLGSVRLAKGVQGRRGPGSFPGPRGSLTSSACGDQELLPFVGELCAVLDHRDEQPPALVGHPRDSLGDHLVRVNTQEFREFERLL